MELLRFTTAGSVDDGKSTLIGRLLYDSKSIFEDQLSQVENSSKRRGLNHTDLALLTDGLRDEREQGITIDVAYRYFATPKRKFIIADTPGHIQYTRNMVTGASTANLALILIDARKGMAEQTHRHTYIASLLKIPHIIVCINKMDLVEYNESVYQNIKSEYSAFVSKLGIDDVRYIPISALKGDNVVTPSGNMPWYKGETLLSNLENTQITNDHNLDQARFPVQTVIRPKEDKFHDYRGYAGRVAGGIFRPGDEVKLLPSGLETKINSIHLFDNEIQEAYPPMSVTMTLEDDVDVARGNMIVKKEGEPNTIQEFDAMLCWFNTSAPLPRTKYVLMHANNETKAILKDVHYKLNINCLEENFEDRDIKMNDIAKVSFRTAKPLFVDDYQSNRLTGSLILVDETTNETVAAGMVL